MKMKTLGKALLITLCALLLVVGSVFGTLAYLTSQDAVTNTFTVGKVVITLDEAKVDEYGVPVSPAERVKTNEYKLIPGKIYTKDPTIHVDRESEKCWLFVKIENGINAIEGNPSIATQLGSLGWSDLGGGIYAYNAIVDPDVDTDLDIEVFETFTINGDADVALYGTAYINITAYAVQADGFDNAAQAWGATFGAPSNP